MNLDNTNNNEQPAPGVAAETNDPQQQPTVDNLPPAAAASAESGDPQQERVDEPSPPLVGVTTPLLQSPDSAILLQHIMEYQARAQEHSAAFLALVRASLAESEKKAEAHRRAAIEQDRQAKQQAEADERARIEREREEAKQQSEKVRGERSARRNALEREHEKIEAESSKWQLKVLQQSQQYSHDFRQQYWRKRQQAAFSKSALIELECEAAATAAANMEDDAKYSEKKVRRRRKKKKKSAKCIEHECAEDTTIDMVVIYSSSDFPVENFSDFFLVENPMAGGAGEQVESTKSESLSPSEPALSARVQLTPAVSNNVGVLRCYVEEMLMFPIGLLVQASACMWKSADAVQSCLTAAEIPVNRLHAKVFKVISSSTVWDPGGLSRAAAVQRSTWMTRRVSEAEERHQHCLAFTSFTSAAGWVGRGDRGTAHSELCWLLRLLLF